MQNSGFREQIQRVIETGIRGFGKFLDVLQGIRVAGKAAELVFEPFQSKAPATSAASCRCNSDGAQ